MTSVRVAVPSKGRLRDAVLLLLDHAGYQLSGLSGAGSTATVENIEFIEMRPRDAGSWLASGRLDAAFVSTIATWPGSWLRSVRGRGWPGTVRAGR